MEKNLFNRWTLFALALLGLTLTLPAQAVSLYKWVDENGRVHYSQTPPETSATQSEQMQLKDRTPYGQQEEPEDASPPEITKETAKVVKVRERNCEIAKKNLETYRSSERIQQPDGTIITLSEEMRAAKMKEMQAQINAYCN